MHARVSSLLCCLLGSLLTSNLALAADAEETDMIRGRVLKFELAPPLRVQEFQLERRSDWQLLFVDDFDGDRCSDILAGERNRLQLFRGNCRGVFSVEPEREIALSEEGFRYLPADLDHDGCAELFGISQRTLIAYRSKCAGPFEKHEIRESPIDIFSGVASVRPISGGPFSEVLLASDRSHSAQRFRLRLPHAVNRYESFETESFERFLGVADVDGDGFKEFVTLTTLLHGTFRAWNDLAKDQTAAEEIWAATFAYGHLWPEVLFGDFNGDGFDDLLARGTGIAGWWLAQSNGRTGLEAPIHFPAMDQSALHAVSDIDDDGTSELISCTTTRSGTCRAFSLDLQGIAGVRLQYGEASVVSGTGGHFELVRGEADLSLVAEDPQYLFRTIPKNALDRGRFNVLAVDTAEFNAEHGRAVHYVDVPEGPKVCLGYTATKGPEISKWAPEFSQCEAQQAWYAVDDTFSKPDDPFNAFGSGYCCPLPAEDVLAGELQEVTTATMCPDSSVVVGIVFTEKREKRKGIRCQAINTSRYELGPMIPGVYVGEGASSRFVRERIDWSDVPPAIQAGLRRAHLEYFGGDGCISPLPGALYVGTNGETGCAAHLFRRLFRRTDTQLSEPVEMFPQCERAPDLRNPLAGCR